MLSGTSYLDMTPDQECIPLDGTTDQLLDSIHGDILATADWTHRSVVFQLDHRIGAALIGHQLDEALYDQLREDEQQHWGYEFTRVDLECGLRGFLYRYKAMTTGGLFVAVLSPGQYTPELLERMVETGVRVFHDCLTTD